MTRLNSAIFILVAALLLPLNVFAHPRDSDQILIYLTDTQIEVTLQTSALPAVLASGQAPDEGAFYSVKVIERAIQHFADNYLNQHMALQCEGINQQLSFVRQRITGATQSVLTKAMLDRTQIMVTTAVAKPKSDCQISFTHNLFADLDHGDGSTWAVPLNTSVFSAERTMLTKKTLLPQQSLTFAVQGTKPSNETREPTGTTTTSWGTYALILLAAAPMIWSVWRWRQQKT